ncbi:ABC transporter permease, partial [Gammaproteobacteria bacterium]|nr:ABC transporter permease [Gammaproteobacteria bacterium]
QDCGVNSLPIILIISFLIGIILAFIGAVQLQSFGAGIYVANLVAVGMTREMSPLMIAIIMTGRTGAAYAAQLGSMQVNEEIDALKTTVISPIDFLVMPRILALVLMIPFLCLFGDFVGFLGGMIISINLLHISFNAYAYQTISSITTVDIAIGLIKSIFFGLIVAIAGCYQGLHCGRNSNSVGSATTKAVVTGILYIIIADAFFEIILNVLNI